MIALTVAMSSFLLNMSCVEFTAIIRLKEACHRRQRKSIRDMCSKAVQTPAWLVYPVGNTGYGC